ncbi:MAG: radical SAM protein [Promethearchaeota archaeon]
MNNLEELLDKFRSGTASWEDYSTMLNLEESQLEPFFKLAQSITSKYFRNLLKIYIPNKRFPAISITGSECSLHCDHCNEKYLGEMKAILNNSELEVFLLDHANDQGLGVLISGGCESDGSVPLYNFIDTMKKIKSQTNLIINAHTGLLDEKTAQKLAEANIDIVSFDINMDQEIIRNIYHLEKDLNDYKKAIDVLNKYDLNVVPHICVGLYYGKLHKELESLKFIKKFLKKLDLIVVIALIPPKFSNKIFERPKPIDIAKIITAIRFLFPKTEISLGCMRPRGEIKIEIEKHAINSGITRIEIPSKKTLQWLKKINSDVELQFYSACCAIPSKFEDQAKSKKSDIKRYSKI